MDNRKLGLTGSLVTLAAVIGFAACMPFSFDFGSYFASLFIAFGFVPMICAFAAQAQPARKGAAMAAVAFSGIYCALICLAYFAQLTTVRFAALSDEALALLDYGRFGLLFQYDLLGYAFMALATLLIADTVEPRGTGDRWLRRLLRIHGVFAVSCFAMPLLGVFRPGMAGGRWIGAAVLEFWCAYFAPVCVLSWRYFLYRACS